MGGPPRLSGATLGLPPGRGVAAAALLLEEVADALVVDLEHGEGDLDGERRVVLQAVRTPGPRGGGSTEGGGVPRRPCGGCGGWRGGVCRGWSKAVDRVPTGCVTGPLAPPPPRLGLQAGPRPPPTPASPCRRPSGTSKRGGGRQLTRRPWQCSSRMVSSFPGWSREWCRDWVADREKFPAGSTQPPGGAPCGGGLGAGVRPQKRGRTPATWRCCWSTLPSGPRIDHLRGGGGEGVTEWALRRVASGATGRGDSAGRAAPAPTSTRDSAPSAGLAMGHPQSSTVCAETMMPPNEFKGYQNVDSIFLFWKNIFSQNRSSLPHTKFLQSKQTHCP